MWMTCISETSWLGINNISVFSYKQNLGISHFESPSAFQYLQFVHVVPFRLNTQPHEIPAVHFLFKQTKYKRQNKDKLLNGPR